MERNFIKFLGTAGARFVVIKQLRASGGIWLNINGVDVLIDPGPGSLVKALSSKPKLSPNKITAIYLSHRHIDHSNDVSIMIEAMTEGGTKKRGFLLAPYDAINEDAVVFPHTINYLSEAPFILQEGKNYKISGINIFTPIKHKHSVETYGCLFSNEKVCIGYIADTLYFDELIDAYKCDILIMNIVLLENKTGVDHLSLSDAEILIKNIKPKVAILTHFGMHMIRAKPWELANKLQEKLNIRTIAANDGFTFPIGEAVNG